MRNTVLHPVSQSCQGLGVHKILAGWVTLVGGRGQSAAVHSCQAVDASSVLDYSVFGLLEGALAGLMSATSLASAEAENACTVWDVTMPLVPASALNGLQLETASKSVSPH